MAKDITVTRREKVQAHLAAAGGSMSMADLHEWSSLKLLCAHQAFSQLMEGMVDDGIVRWDGTTFTLADAPPPPAARAADHDHGGHDHGGHDHGGHDHDHGGHDHDHEHGGPSRPHPKDARYGDGQEMDLPQGGRPRRSAPPPPPPAPPSPSGLRAGLKGAFKKLLGRG